MTLCHNKPVNLVKRVTGVMKVALACKAYTCNIILDIPGAAIYGLTPQYEADAA